MPVQTAIKLRRDTAANWLSTDPVLAAGETGLETDTGLVKYGNGVSAWSALAYSPSSRVTLLAKSNVSDTLTKGTVVHVHGGDGDKPSMNRMDIDVNVNHFLNPLQRNLPLIGLVAEDVAPYAVGEVVMHGLLRNYNFGSLASPGTALWLSSTPGEFQLNDQPAKPARSILLGSTVYNGEYDATDIFVNVQHGEALNDLFDVDVTTPTNNHVLAWDALSSKWVDKSISEVGGAPLESPEFTGTLTSTGATFSGNLSMGASAITMNNNSLIGANNGGLWIDSDEVVLPANTRIGNVSAAEIGHLDGVTSALQPQINEINSKFNTVSGSSAQLIQAGIGVPDPIVLPKFILSASNITFDPLFPMDITLNPGDTYYLTNSEAGVPGQNIDNIQLVIDSSGNNFSVPVNSSDDAAVLSWLQDAAATPPTFAPVFTNAPTIHFDSVTEITATEVSYLHGVTSNIQTQLDSKASAGQAYALSDLSDVDAADPSDGDLLMYSAGSTSWDKVASSTLAAVDATPTVAGKLMGSTNNTHGYRAVLLGEFAGASSPNYLENSVGIGTSALSASSTFFSGSYSVAVGGFAMGYGEAGTESVAVGHESLLYDNTATVAGGYNTAVGTGSMRSSTDGQYNVALGYRALRDATAAVETVAVGANSGGTGSNNVFIGNYAGNGSTASNVLYIANSNTTTPLIYGEFDNKKLTINGSLKLTEATREKIYITGTASSGTYNFYTQTDGAFHYITANATTNTSVNFYAASGVALNTVMAIGESLTTTFLMTNGTTAYFAQIWRVGADNLPMKWLGGTAPSSGNANSVDAYTVTIVKTADNTFTGFGSVSKFA